MKHQKEILRIESRRHRARQVVHPDDAQRAADLFFDHFSPQPTDIIAAYMPKGREFDPLPILDRALALGLACALPVTEAGTRLMRFAPYSHDAPMQEGRYGIYEPSSTQSLTPSIIITPLLSFDRRGYRLGQGGGYYDTTLAHYSDARAVGVAYSDQICLFPLPVDEHDHKMDAIITPQEVMVFS